MSVKRRVGSVALFGTRFAHIVQKRGKSCVERILLFGGVFECQHIVFPHGINVVAVLPHPKTFPQFRQYVTEKRLFGSPTARITLSSRSFAPANGSTKRVPSCAIAFMVKSRRARSSSMFLANSIRSGCRLSEYPRSLRNVVTSMTATPGSFDPVFTPTVPN